MKSTDAAPDNYMRLQGMPRFKEPLNDDSFDFEKVMVPGGNGNNQIDIN